MFPHSFVGHKTGAQIVCSAIKLNKNNWNYINCLSLSYLPRSPHKSIQHTDAWHRLRYSVGLQGIKHLLWFEINYMVNMHAMIAIPKKEKQYKYKYKYKWILPIWDSICESQVHVSKQKASKLKQTNQTNPNQTNERKLSEGNEMKRKEEKKRKTITKWYQNSCRTEKKRFYFLLFYLFLHSLLLW